MTLRSKLVLAGAMASLALATTASGSVESLGGDRVRFSFRPGAGAHSVHVAGSFNDWSKDATPLRDDDGDGLFEATITLPKGKHTYKFIVNGSQWLQDKENPAAEEDGLGGWNSVVDLAGGAAGKPAPKGDGGGSSAFGSTVERESHICFVGEVYFLEPGTRRLPDYSRMTRHGKIYADDLNIAPQSFDKGFPGLTDRFEWFGIRYRGKFLVEKSGVHRFRILSDDGARLYIDGKLAIDNDGLHGPQSKEQLIKLKEGEHDVVIDYMQGPALEVALQVWVTKPKSTNEELLKPCTAAPKEDSTRAD